MWWFFILKVIPVSKLLLKQPLALMVIYSINFEVFYFQQQFKYLFIVKISCIIYQFQSTLQL